MDKTNQVSEEINLSLMCCVRNLKIIYIHFSTLSLFASRSPAPIRTSMYSSTISERCASAFIGFLEASLRFCTRIVLFCTRRFSDSLVMASKSFADISNCSISPMLFDDSKKQVNVSSFGLVTFTLRPDDRNESSEPRK